MLLPEKFELDDVRKNYRELAECLDDLENASRADSVLLSGNEIPTVSPTENLPQFVSGLFKNKLSNRVNIDNIFFAHRLGKKPTTQKPDRRKIIVVKFKHQDQRNDALHTAKQVKPDGLYLNENLTAKRFSIPLDRLRNFIQTRLMVLVLLMEESLLG